MNNEHYHYYLFQLSSASHSYGTMAATFGFKDKKITLHKINKIQKWASSQYGDGFEVELFSYMGYMDEETFENGTDNDKAGL